MSWERGCDDIAVKIKSRSSPHMTPQMSIPSPITHAVTAGLITDIIVWNYINTLYRYHAIIINIKYTIIEPSPRNRVPISNLKQEWVCMGYHCFAVCIPVAVSPMNPSISSLKDIETLLGDRRRFSGNATFFGDRKLYDESLLVFRQITSRNNYCSYLASKICKRLKDRSPGLAEGELSICSIGCGDGEADYKVLSKVSEVLPNAVINYFGVDINSTSCVQTETKLANLPYKSIVINQGIEDVDPESLP